MEEDIRAYLNFINSKKLKKLVRRAGKEATHSLLMLWLKTAEERPKGHLFGYSLEDIELDADWGGEEGVFIDALIHAKFLDKNPDGSYSLHNWKKRQPWVYNSPERSDSGRFSRLAKVNREAFEDLKAKGINSITKEDYEKLTNKVRYLPDKEVSSGTQEGVDEPSTNRQKKRSKKSKADKSEPVPEENITEPQRNVNESSKKINESSTNRQRDVEVALTPAPTPYTSSSSFSSSISNYTYKKIREFVFSYQNKKIEKFGKNALPVTEDLVEEGMKEIELLITEDSYELDYIIQCLEWGSEDEFWKAKIMNLTNIRETIQGSSRKLMRFKSLALDFESKGKKKANIKFKGNYGNDQMSFGVCRNG